MITRDYIITHILSMMKTDIEYARHALRFYADLLPDMNLIVGVRDAINAIDQGRELSERKYGLEG